MRKILVTPFAFSGLIMLLVYQNCSDFVINTEAIGLASLGAMQSAGATLVPNTDKFDDSCARNPNYDACIFDQNPLKRGGKLSSNSSQRLQELASRARYGVKLTSLNGNGRLENPTISVSAIRTPEASASAMALKANPGLPNSSAFEQANTYYWINRAAEYFDARTNGSLPAKNKGVRAVVDDSVTGYDTGKNTIRLKKNDQNAAAWSGGIAVHLFGVANLMLANPSGWSSLSNSKHAQCGVLDKGCCTAAVGCGNAIRFGVGEYFAACMFPEDTRIGEALVNSGQAQNLNGINREVNQLSSTSASSAFTAASGNAEALGLIYASMWLEIRKQSGNQSAEIDRLFLEHLSVVDGSDDFRTAFNKVKSIDARLFNGNHSAKFDRQLSQRGI